MDPAAQTCAILAAIFFVVALIFAAIGGPIRRTPVGHVFLWIALFFVSLSAGNGLIVATAIIGS